MKVSDHFTGTDLFDQLARWLTEHHQFEEYIHITGYYVPEKGGLIAYYETDSYP